MALTTSLLPKGDIYAKKNRINDFKIAINGFKILKAWHQRGKISKSVTLSLTSSSTKDKIAITYKGILKKRLDNMVKDEQITSFNITKRGNSVCANAYINTNTHGVHSNALDLIPPTTKIFGDLLCKSFSLTHAVVMLGTFWINIDVSTNFGGIATAGGANDIIAFEQGVESELNSLMIKNDDNIPFIISQFNLYTSKPVLSMNIAEVIFTIEAIRTSLNNRIYSPVAGSFAWQRAFDNITISLYSILNDQTIDKSRIQNLDIDIRVLLFIKSFSMYALAKYFNKGPVSLISMMNNTYTWPVLALSAGDLTNINGLLRGQHGNSSQNDSIFNHCYSAFLGKYTGEHAVSTIDNGSLCRDFMKIIFDSYLFTKDIYQNLGKSFDLVIPEFEDNHQLLRGIFNV